MELGLTQREFARRLDVSVETIRNWELAHARPGLRNAPKLAQDREFSGKFLLADFPTRLHAARLRLGLSQAEVAAQIGVSQDSVVGWERGDHEPWDKHRAPAEKLIELALTADERLAFRIRSLRKRLGLTQKELSAHLGVYYKTVSKWECGRQRPSEETLQQIRNLNEALAPRRTGK